MVLNLRYPTVGESSGTLLRALGMGKAVVVSDVGSFGEYPDEICLKAPVDATEEDHLFEYLNLLVSRPEVARALGARRAPMGGARMQLGIGGASATPIFSKPWWKAGNWPRAGAATQSSKPEPECRRPSRTGEYIASWAPVRGWLARLRRNAT